MTTQLENPVTVDLALVAANIQLNLSHVQGVVALLDEGNTVPFITRYRKERTGNLNEEQIRAVEEQVANFRQLADRANAILRSIEGQGKLTVELRHAIVGADSLKRLEDLYLPFKPKRRSRAMAARERGLEPLADAIWSEDRAINSLDTVARSYVNPDQELPTTDEVLRGASDILAERISEDAEIREKAREIAQQTGQLVVVATKDGRENGLEYQDYFDYSERVARLPPHRAMAINRGEKAGALRVKLDWDGERAERMVQGHYRLRHHRFLDFLSDCISDALNRLIQPSLDREIRRDMTDRAETHAVEVFAQNLRALLMQPPLDGQRVLAIDPGFRTGCKVAVLSETGKCLHHDVIYIIGSAEKIVETRGKLVELLRRFEIPLIAIGNGTACRETEELVAATIDEHSLDCRYVIVNESGASIYSASPIAGDEFPDLDATVRGTISIGRRLQDPLSELVKIEPQHLGVGMYQHDVNAKRLQESLDQVISSCVNFVGVNLNTASASLLRYVSGLNQKTARQVVDWRNEVGRFKNRQQLLEVPGLGKTKFTQAAGFLRIKDGDQPLDSTWIHPESYQATRRILKQLDLAPSQVLGDPVSRELLQTKAAEFDRKTLAESVGLGLPTLDDILNDLSRPGRDPRTNLPGPVFKQGVMKLDDLHEGMPLNGTVLNVVDFGAFVDIGIKDSGLVHISQMANRFVASPHEIVSIGDVIKVWVLSIDRDRHRVGLTMRDPAS
ncbi:MAG: Tex family protein [Planctomycetota bacterium]|nr:Tex family protein [Planctomycetota bacterium]